jgi:hypothetical protein
VGGGNYRVYFVVEMPIVGTHVFGIAGKNRTAVVDDIVGGKRSDRMGCADSRIPSTSYSGRTGKKDFTGIKCLGKQ